MKASDSQFMRLFSRPSFLFSLFVTVPIFLFFILLAVVLYPFDQIYSLFRYGRFFKQGRFGPLVERARRGWYRTMMKAHGVHVQIEGISAGELKAMKSCIFALNHQSALDILVHMALLPEKSLFVAKRELARIPLFGLGARLVGTIFIDRQKGTGNEGLKEIGRLLNEGHSINIYPEGTRSADGTLLNFKRGAFVMAIQFQVPVVPVTIWGTKDLCPKKSLSIAPGKVWLKVSAPISTAGMTTEDRFRLTEQVHDQIAKDIEELKVLAKVS